MHERAAAKMVARCASVRPPDTVDLLDELLELDELEELDELVLDEVLLEELLAWDEEP